MKTTTKTKMAAKILTTLAILTSLTGCDRFGGREFARERADRLYRTAMDDYQSGRLTQAVEGLKEVCGKDPANASARFQLACLLQDFSKDYFGAACAFREYLMQQPDSDKAKLAKERFAACEKAMAGALCEKYGLNSVATQQKLLDAARAESKRLESRNKKLSSDLEAAMRRISALSQETDRLKDAMSATSPDETAPAAVSDIRTAKELLDDDEADAEAAKELDGEKKQAKALLEEDEAEPAPMIAQSPDARQKRDEARAREEAARREAAAKAEPLHEARPDSYVVQEGDTLYKIAMRFYGRSSAWSHIRDANKATISMDGRVKTGQKIMLPPLPVK